MKFKLPVRTRKAIESGRFVNKIKVPRDYIASDAPDRPGDVVSTLDFENNDDYKNITAFAIDPAYFLNIVKIKNTDGTCRVSNTCPCSQEDEDETNGLYVCTSCGVIKGPVYVAAHAWHGTHTIIHKQTYDFLKYLDKHMQKMSGKVPHDAIRKIRAVFPRIFNTFFKIAPLRKNFMSYGFVMRKLMDIMKLPYDDRLIPTIKTGSRVRLCESYWTLILTRINLTGLVPWIE